MNFMVHPARIGNTQLYRVHMDVERPLYADVEVTRLTAFTFAGRLVAVSTEFHSWITSTKVPYFNRHKDVVLSELQGTPYPVSENTLQHVLGSLIQGGYYENLY